MLLVRRYHQGGFHGLSSQWSTSFVSCLNGLHFCRSSYKAKLHQRQAKLHNMQAPLMPLHRYVRIAQGETGRTGDSLSWVNTCRSCAKKVLEGSSKAWDSLWRQSLSSMPCSSQRVGRWSDCSYTKTVSSSRQPELGSPSSC